MNLRKLYIDHFIKNGHKQIPSAPLVPENDPTVLFNTAGMQPLTPYLMGQEHPYGKRLVNYQKCIRTSDLDEVGDNTHHTFFEMLGNWSLGDYFKKESIEFSYDFLINVLKLPKEKLAVSVFKGNEDIPKDNESAKCWINLGIPKERIAYLGMEDNFWIAGNTGPCGPDTEIFYFRSDDDVPNHFDPKDNRWVEIWNNVFMEYNKNIDGSFTELPNKNVDTGMGYERVVSILEGVNDNYTSSIWIDVINLISEISNKNYDENKESMRIIADHYKAAAFILSDPSKITPSNTDQGYILRRLIRRAIRHAKKLEIDLQSDFDQKITKIIISQYEEYYPELKENKNFILKELKVEKERFNRTLEKGLREFNKLINNNKDLKIIDGNNAFRLYDTYGFPIELTEELAKEKNIKVDIKGYKQKFKKHQEKSRKGAEKKFKGGLAGTGETEIKYHTATHLLNAALKVILNENVTQRGANITSERLRFDFNFDRKLTDEEKTNIENLVNKWINENQDVTMKKMKKEDAIKLKADGMFFDRYPDIVDVYFIGDVSKEICGGPHVKNTSEIGHFKIVKEESSASGVRRIRAVLN